MHENVPVELDAFATLGEGLITFARSEMKAFVKEDCHELAVAQVQRQDRWAALIKLSQDFLSKPL